MDNFTIMLPVHRGNLPLANECIQHLLNTCGLNIICVDDFGNDNDYIQNPRLSFIHNSFPSRQPLVKIWNQCIKECPTDNVIIASWRQRPTPADFILIQDKLDEGYGLVTFDGLHFFGFNKYLCNVIGLFDEGFTKGQYEDTDWFNRIKTHDIAFYMGDMREHPYPSTWLEGAEHNRNYYHSKWIEDTANNVLVQKAEEVNIGDRKLFDKITPIDFKPFSHSVLTENVANYFKLFKYYKKWN